MRIPFGKPLAVAAAAVVLIALGATASISPAQAGPGKKMAKVDRGAGMRGEMRSRERRGRDWARSGRRMMIGNRDGSKTIVNEDRRGNVERYRKPTRRTHYSEKTTYGTKTVFFNKDGSRTIVMRNRYGGVISRKTVGKSASKEATRKRRKLPKYDRAHYTVRTATGSKTVIDNGNGTKTIILRSKSGRVYSAHTVKMRRKKAEFARARRKGVTTTVKRQRGGQMKVTRVRHRTKRKR